ncbi:unnamed protein product [Nezara viridula]|uniref:Uncharacterized protein n=1 Tax=Nezara viridula TaxID=85310 RepID=A0A9P0ED83_NEZVI|nr:unnamed protein product [Nezara viridula]
MNSLLYYLKQFKGYALFGNLNRSRGMLFKQH